MCINMMIRLMLCGLMLLTFMACDEVDQREKVVSPDGKIKVTFHLDAGRPYYSVNYAEKDIITKSELGFRFKRHYPLDKNFIILDTQTDSVDETWEQPWGEVKEVQNRYNEMKVMLQEIKDPFRKMNVIFRVFDDGIGFRYEIPQQPKMTEFEITSEKTEFAFGEDHSAWWIPANYDSYEQLYTNSAMSEVPAANTPVTLEAGNGLHISIHEANLTDYAGMTVKGISEKPFTFKSELCPWPEGVKVKATAPMVTPWRTIQLADNAAKLIESTLILNLNEPNRLDDVSWITPLKYIGIWWEMHLGKSTWQPGPTHGATTEHTKELIDFAAQEGIDAVLVEGWNLGWETWGDYSYTTAYDDYDWDYLVDYAHTKGVQIVMHNETGGEVGNYEAQLDEAFALYEAMGLNSIKSGYVGRIEPGDYHHHGQWMVNHYRRVVEKAAEHRIMLDVHEPIKPTGIRRTYPNMMTREGVRGMEWNAFNSIGNPPDHTTIVPFTRMLAGPIDYTPGIFDLLFPEYQGDNRVRTTLAKQLALYVVIYSPMQMAADLIENYKDQPAFQFIKDVPVDWDETRVIHGKIGDYVTIARRADQSWYIGSISDETSRQLTLPLDFLDAGTQYRATVYADAPDASYETNPHAVTIDEIQVDSETVLDIKLATSGGQAIRIVPVD